MENRNLVSPIGAFIDVILSICFYIFMITVCMEHVPAETAKMKLIFGAYCAFPLGGVFWIAISLLRVTWVDMRRRRAIGKDI